MQVKGPLAKADLDIFLELETVVRALGAIPRDELDALAHIRIGAYEPICCFDIHKPGIHLRSPLLGVGVRRVRLEYLNIRPRVPRSRGKRAENGQGKRQVSCRAGDGHEYLRQQPHGPPGSPTEFPAGKALSVCTVI